MLFNSYIFIFAFFPAFVTGYFLLNRLSDRRYALVFVTGMSLVFYGYNHIGYVPVIVSSILVNYAVSRLLVSGRFAERERARKLILAGGIVFNLGLIFYFKYFDFFLENVNAVFHTDFVLRHILLPLGISFFTFQQISFVVDSYRLETAGYGFIEYAAFVTFFPQLVAGPIVLHTELIPQFRDDTNRKPDWDNLYEGAFRFTMGLFKKVMLADTFAKAVAWGFGHREIATSGDMFWVMICLNFQTYFDFSGYSDIAAGLARMVNLTLPINFDSPYKAYTIREFWRRWHMTLTRFMTRYVYIPLGGSRKGRIRTNVNLLAVFVLSGIWHGASWAFVLWGFLHGALIVLDRVFEKPIERCHGAFRWAFTFLALNVMALLFRSETIAEWWSILAKMISMDSLAVSDGLIAAFALPEWDVIFTLLHLNGLNALIRGFPMVIAVFAGFFICLCFENTYRREVRRNIPTVLFTAGAFVWSVLSLSGESVFLYFHF